MSYAYNEYLTSHIGAVNYAAGWMVEHVGSVRDMGTSEVLRFSSIVSNHDASKWGPDEYGPYDAYLYGDRDEEAFDRAWLHHIHNNPHHWQHWLLMSDDGKYREPGKVTPIEMPRVYALEMVADWWSFSWRSGNLSEVFGWYDEHKDCIMLHPDTRAFVEHVLGEIRDALSGDSK